MNPVQQNTFLCGFNQGALMKHLSKIAPQCSQCRYPKTQICLEKCCEANALYCPECEKDIHFLHRTNDIRMLFIDKSLLANSESIQFRRLKRLLRQLDIQKQTAQKLADSLLQLVQLYDRNIEQVQTKINFIKENRWHTSLYSTTAKSINDKLDLEESRRKLLRSFEKMRLDVFDDLQLTSLADTVKYLEDIHPLTSRAANWHREFEDHLAWRLPDQRLEKILRDTVYGSYIQLNQIPFSLDGSTDISVICCATDLDTTRILAKRVRLTRQLPEQQAREIDLQKLLPVTVELELQFLPKSFPPNLKKLGLKLTEKIADERLCLFPETLSMVRFEAKNDGAKASEAIMAELLKLQALKALDLWVDDHTMKSIKEAVKLATINNFFWLTFSDQSGGHGNMLIGNQYKGLENTRQAYVRHELQIAALCKSPVIRGICYEFREGLLNALNEQATKIKSEEEMIVLKNEDD